MFGKSIGYVCGGAGTLTTLGSSHGESLTKASTLIVEPDNGRSIQEPALNATLLLKPPITYFVTILQSKRGGGRQGGCYRTHLFVGIHQGNLFDTFAQAIKLNCRKLSVSILVIEIYRATQLGKNATTFSLTYSRTPNQVILHNTGQKEVGCHARHDYVQEEIETGHQLPRGTADYPCTMALRTYPMLDSPNS